APLGSLAHQQLDSWGGFRQRLNPFRKITRGKLAAVIITALAVSFYANGFFNGALTDPASLKRVARFIGAMFPPESDLSFLLSLASPLYQTIRISVMATLIGIAIGSLFSLPPPSTLA